MIDKISVTILTKNSQNHIEKVLTSLSRFNEILVFDTGSSDETIAIAKGFKNVRLVQGMFEGFGPTHNIASSLVKNDWVLSIDSDEVASEELIDELSTITLNDETVYTIERNNFFQEKHIAGCGWSDDRVTRLYNKKKTAFSSDLVHEKIIVDGLYTHALQGRLNHFPYETIADFLEKMQSYSTLFAHQNKKKKKSSLLKAILHGFFSFFKSYFIKKGIFLGSQGFIISAYNGHVAYYKYLKLAEINRENTCLN